MSFTESVHGIHEFMTFTDVLAIFGHNADYIVCSRRSLVAHTETTGVSMLVQITRSSGRQPRWIRTDDNAMQINDNRDKPDCLWLSVSRNLVIADVGFLFQTYAVVWLMRGGGAMWFRGYSAESGDWSDSVNRWPETPFLGHPGPREGRVGWLQNCGSDSKDARSAVGLPPLHLWEAIEWLERLSPSISQACALRFYKKRECSNWTYACGDDEFLSWQNDADAGTCDSWANFVLGHNSVPVLRLLLDWAAQFASNNPLICRVSMRDAETVRLVTSMPSNGCAIDFLFSI